MTWTAPMTALDGDIFTASQFNAHIRDNLLETSPALAETVGSHFTGVEANVLNERTSATELIATSQTTSSTTYTNLATVGPSVKVTSGFGMLIIIGCTLGNSSSLQDTFMTFEVTEPDPEGGSGSVVAAANDAWAVARLLGVRNNYRYSASRASFLTGFSVGEKTVTAKYKVDGGTGTFLNRTLTVIPF